MPELCCHIRSALLLKADICTQKKSPRANSGHGAKRSLNHEEAHCEKYDSSRRRAVNLLSRSDSHRSHNESFEMRGQMPGI